MVSTVLVRPSSIFCPFDRESSKKMSIKFPFDVPGWHVTIRPRTGVEDDLAPVLVEKCKTFEYAIVTFEGDGESKHMHAILAYAGSNSNLRRQFTRLLDTKDVDYGQAGVHVKKISRTVHNSVQYLYKESEPVLVKGFQETWINTCKKKRGRVEKKREMIPQTRVGEYVEMYAAEKDMRLESIRDVAETFHEMLCDGYIVKNRRVCISILKDYFANINREKHLDDILYEFGVTRFD